MKQTEKDSNFSSTDFVSRLKEREHQAVSTLVHAYTDQLLRASLGLGFDQTAAEELVQSVWTTFFDVISEFQGRSHIRTFIFGILYNKASELRRDHKRFDTPDPVEEVLEKRFDADGKWAKPPISPEDFLLGTETLDLIQKCLDSLPINQRMAFAMKEVEERESPEICKILSVTVTNLGVLLYRARNRLRECVEGKMGSRGA